MIACVSGKYALVSRGVKILAMLMGVAVLGLWVGVMWASVDRLRGESEPEISGPPAVVVTTEP